MNKVLLEAKNISKIYNLGTKHPVKALSDVSLHVYEGDFLCIMGPSGSGKSTLLNAIATIDEPTNGTVYIDGEDINIMSEKKKGRFRYEKLGFIFQNYNLLQSLTIYENIATPLSLQKKKTLEMKERITVFTKKLKVDDILDKLPSECSGGQKQRVAICRALVTNPKLIVADEPTGNLDSKNSHELLSLFKKMNEEEQIAIVMVTHDPQIASYSSKLLYIKDGVIEQELVREKQSQRDYFYDIIKITSSESQKLFEK